MINLIEYCDENLTLMKIKCYFRADLYIHLNCISYGLIFSNENFKYKDCHIKFYDRGN